MDGKLRKLFGKWNVVKEGKNEPWQASKNDGGPMGIAISVAGVHSTARVICLGPSSQPGEWQGGWEVKNLKLFWGS